MHGSHLDKRYLRMILVQLRDSESDLVGIEKVNDHAIGVLPPRSQDDQGGHDRWQSIRQRQK